MIIAVKRIDISSPELMELRDFDAKLLNFELANLGIVYSDLYGYVPIMMTINPETNVYAYSAPEYMATGYLSLVSGVYRFGVVLLESLTGQRVVDGKRPLESRYLVEWSRPLLSDRRLKMVMDPHLEGQYPEKCTFNQRRNYWENSDVQILLLMSWGAARKKRSSSLSECMERENIQRHLFSIKQCLKNSR
ncbi:hypothetical protein LguiA_030853 [Lonicera macranthoides]